MTEQTELVKKLTKQVARLKKRLLEKQKYEMGMLLNSGATPKFIENIRRKDELALRED